MKLQNMTVIFIIIIIPIILVISYYIGLEIKTVATQNSYNTKLQTATNDSIQALEINTVEWNSEYSKLADSRRRDVLAAINTFTTSLANSMGMSGASKEMMQTYVPAIAYTMYDGYYIYSTSLVQEQDLDENGRTKFNEAGELEYTGNQSYNYVLKPYNAYSARYTSGGIDITVNYTLDNYIKIYDNNGGDLTKEGYLVLCDDNNGVNNISDGQITGITYRGYTVVPETLKETISIKNSADDGEHLEEYEYIYDKDNRKIYYDESSSNFFELDKNNQKAYLLDARRGSSNNRYKKISVPVLTGTTWEICEVLQLLNPDGDGLFKGDLSNNVVSLSGIDLNKDYSAINYCVESYVFTKWVNTNLATITRGDFVEPDGFVEYISVDNATNIFSINENNNPDPQNEDAYSISPLAQHKKNVMINLLTNNLAQATEQAQVRNSDYEYRLPQISYNEWEQALKNVSIIAFMQGIPIGLKYYNNYKIATSTLNKEYVDPNEIYFSGINDEYYHRLICEEATESNYTGYRSIDYVEKKYKVWNVASGATEDKYYYKHVRTTGDNDSTLSCYYCLVNRANYRQDDNATWVGGIYNSGIQAYYNALARERYVNI